MTKIKKLIRQHPSARKRKDSLAPLIIVALILLGSASYIAWNHYSQQQDLARFELAQESTQLLINNINKEVKALERKQLESCSAVHQKGGESDLACETGFSLLFAVLNTASANQYVDRVTSTVAKSVTIANNPNNTKKFLGQNGPSDGLENLTYGFKDSQTGMQCSLNFYYYDPTVSTNVINGLSVLGSGYNLQTEIVCSDDAKAEHFDRSDV